MAKATDISRFLPPAARRLRRLTRKSAKTFADRRKRKRITIEEINKFGAQALSSEQREELTKAPDKRSAFTKFLDIIDMPRNVVANIVAKIAGVTPKKQREGAIFKKVWASDLLEAMGMKKGVGRAVTGFIGDVALDPLTYLTAGAVTGTRIARGIPKILKPGTQAIKRTGLAAVTGNLAAISGDVARAAGMSPQRLIRLGASRVRQVARSKPAIMKRWTQAKIRKEAAKQLMAARGGILPRRIVAGVAGRRGVEAAKGARQFVAKFGEKGRTLLRVPFAKRGLMLPVGKRARQFREMAAGKPTKELLKQIAHRRAIGKAGVDIAARSAERKAGIEGALAMRAAGTTERAAQLTEATRRQVQAKGFTQALMRQVSGGVPLPGGKPTGKQVKELRRLTKGVLKPIKTNEAAIRRAAQSKASEAANRAYAEFQKIEQAQTVLRQQGKLTKAKISADSARKKELVGVMSQASKELRDIPKAAKQEIRRLRGVQVAERGELSRIAFDPAASELTRAQAQEFAGKPYYTQAQARLIHGKVGPGGLREASLGRRFVTEAGRIKRRLFGGGTSEVGQLAAGAEAAIRTRAPAAHQMAQAAWAKKMQPIVERLAQQTGKSIDEIQAVMVDLVEFGRKGARFAPNDPIRQSVIGIIPHLDDEAKAIVREYGRMHGELLHELQAAGVSPGIIEPLVPRRLTEQFRKIGTPEARRALVDVGFDPKRTKELRWLDTTTGQVHTALSSNADEVKRLTAEFGKPERFDISLRRWNTDPDIARSLQPELAEKIPQFKATLPEAAGELAKQRVTRLALADMKNIADTTGVPADLVAGVATRGQYPGFAQVRWEKFRNTPAYQTVFRGLEGKAYPQQIVDMIERFMTLSAQPTEIRRLLGWTDKTLNLWKGVTLAHPAYTIRNIGQNLLGNWMAGQKMIPYMAQARPGSGIHKAAKAAITGGTVDGTILTAGREIPLQQFAEWGKQFNIVMSGHIGEALPGVAQAPGKFIRRFKPLSWWFRMNSEIESTMKMASLWGFLDQGYDVRAAAQKVAQAMPDLADLTLFERNVGRRLLPFYCVPEDHRALTRNGWKTYKQLRVGEDVLTYNIEEDKAQWQPLEAINVFDYNGVLMTLSGKMGEYAFTPEHRWPVWHNTTKAGKDVYRQRKVVRGYELRSSHRIPRSAPFDFSQADKSISAREAAILGWIYCDGHMRIRRGKYPEAVVYQKKEKYRLTIRILLGADARKEYTHLGTGVIRFSMSSTLARRMYELCPDAEHLPSIASRLTKTATEAMWLAMFQAEGSSHPRAGDQFAQMGGPTLVAFQMLTIMRNRTANTKRSPDAPGMNGCYISRSRRWMKVANSIAYRWHKGPIWCPTTANATWFMEHNGRVIITGNSWFRKNGALQLFHYLPQKPAFIAAPAKIKQALETALRGDNVVPEELRPAWMQAMQAIQISGDKEKGAVFLSASWLPFQEVVKLGSGAFDIGEGARAVAEMGRPSLRFIAEQAAGQDIFRRTPLEPTSPVEAMRRLPEAFIGRGPLGGVLGIRPLREAFRVAEMPGPAEAVLRAFVGGAFQPVSRVRGLGAEYQRLRGLAMELRQKINRALQVNDQSLADQLQRQYLQALIEMYQKGLPGVPKATQQLFEQAGVQAGPPAFEQGR